MSDLQLVSVRQSDSGGFLLVLNEDSALDAVGQFLWPTGVPSAAEDCGRGPGDVPSHRS